MRPGGVSGAAAQVTERGRGRRLPVEGDDREVGGHAGAPLWFHSDRASQACPASVVLTDAADTLAAVPEVLTDEPLAPRTTLRLGGPARWLVEATTEAEVVDAVRAADAAGRAAARARGRQQRRDRRRGLRRHRRPRRDRGVERDDGAGGRVRLTVAAGEPWDEVVAGAVADGLAGVECLSGIPGLDRRDADPERRRLRAGGRVDDHLGSRARPPRPARSASCRRPTAASPTAQRVQGARAATSSWR